MANKKINELDSRASLSLSDLMAVGDPSTGYLYKTTISDLKTLTGAGVISFNGRFGAVSPAEGDYTLNQLGDVIITSASNGQVLQYNGSNWVNAALPPETDTLDSVTDRGNTTTNDITVGSVTAAGLSNLVGQIKTFATTGNVYIGDSPVTATDAGYKVDISGKFRVKSSVERMAKFEHTNGTFFDIVVGNGVDATDGNIEIHRNGEYVIQFSGSSIGLKYPTIKSYNGSGMTLIGGVGGGSSVGNSVRIMGSAFDIGAMTPTSGELNTLIIGGGANEVWQVSSGNATYNLLQMTPIFNTTGSYSGTARGLYINPTFTSQTGLTFYAIDAVAGKVKLGDLAGTGSRMVVTDANGLLSTQAIPGGNVSSVFGRTGAVVAASGDYTTSQVTEGTNLYFTDARSRAAISVTAPLTYNSSTGVLNINQATIETSGWLSFTDWNTFNSKQAALNGTGFVKISGTTISYDNSTYLTTASAASTYLALSGGTLTGALTGTSAAFNGNLQLINANPTINFTTNTTITTTMFSIVAAQYVGSAPYNSNVFKAFNSSDIAFEVGGSDRLIIKSTGNVGIGTINPSQILHLRTAFAESTGVGTAIQIESSGAGGDQGWVGMNKGTGNGLTFSVENRDIIFRTAATTPFGGNERMRITNGGALGIGTNTPSSILQIQEATPIFTFNQTTSNSNQGIYFNGIGINYGRITNNQSTGLMTIQNGINNGDGYAIRFITDGSERMRITPTGSVLIGTTSGVSGGGALQVNGDVNINGNFKINGTTIGGGGGSGVTGSGTSAYLTKWTGASTLGNSVLYDTGTSIGIGTTSPNTTLQAIGGISARTNTTGDSFYRLYLDGNITAHWYSDRAGSKINIGSVTSIPLILETSGIERERITAGGNHLIGTTTDLGGNYKLQVNGSISMAYASFFNFKGSSGAGDVLVDNSGSALRVTGNMTVSGSVSASGGFFDTSDYRLKTLIQDNYLANSISTVKAKLYTKNGKQEIGYYAQDLQSILPSAVMEGVDGFLSLSYSQVHTAKIAVIEDEVSILKNRVSELEYKLQKYES